MKLQDKELALIQQILAEIVPQCEVWAFGSRVNGNPKPFSDLDLALIDRQAIPLGTRANLAEAFSESDLPWKVDLVDWHSISPEFQKIIETNFEVVQTPASSKPSK
ncbi:MAG: nucleotidyltransferase domain-containing protein [Gammaproteobacteria bacterium]|uniref:nucleotidyltransferase family protein n=1 Tax=Limnobacter TaxID=131079 RepID=UPI0023AFAE41|nr:nucleotidyltransferase domain-containing protein [Limnobacter sp. P1]MBU0542337.1 nucleotidyltransferase domain-containing protein [Gammaproteobacteria bacterium]